MANSSIARWSMYAKALKGHIDHLPDIADQLSGSISLSQDYDRRERARKMNADAMFALRQARIFSDERDISWGEKQKNIISLQRLRLSLQQLNIKDHECEGNPLSRHDHE
jgi:hypothetical protein